MSDDRLYRLLPALYRERDADAGYPLRALLRIVEQQADVVQRDVEALYDDLFIETCRDWVVPYIGDLVSNNLLFDASRTAAADTASTLFPDLTGPDLRPPIAVRARADVAKTIYYRRRKGTLPMLEELVRDVAGWPAHAVEFFQLLGWNQMLEHIRPAVQWTDVRSPERMDRVGSAFDETAHTVDVRRIAQTEGWHNLRTIGFFLWRLRSYGLRTVPARPAAPGWGFHFSPLGNPAPLFARWRREGDEAGLSTELHVPGRIRRSFFDADLAAYRNAAPPRPDYTNLYGLFEPHAGSPLVAHPDASLVIVRNGEPVAPAADPAAPASTYHAQVICRRLDPWPPTQPAGRVVAVDVHAGRLAFGDGWPDATDSVDVSFHYGFPADIGGGPYDRRNWLVDPSLESLERRLFVSESGSFPPGTPSSDAFTSVTAALADWESPSAGSDRANAVVTILDSRTYALPAAVTLRNDGWLVLEAANGERPVLQTADATAPLEISVLPPAVATDPDRAAALTLSGVVVEGSLHVTGDLARLRLLHATLVPGRRLDEATGNPASADPSVVVEPGTDAVPLNSLLEIEGAFSICGPLVAPSHAAQMTLLDCIVDGLEGTALRGPALEIERSTVLGATAVERLEASESIFTDTVIVARTQEGCVRFSYVPPDSRTPQRYRCQPDLAVAAAIAEAHARNPALTATERDAVRTHVENGVVPAFAATRYGQPAYVQLRLTAPDEIRAGAEDGAEMGVYCHVKQAQRESNLRVRLDEYLPFGAEAGVIYVT